MGDKPFTEIVSGFQDTQGPKRIDQIETADGQATTESCQEAKEFQGKASAFYQEYRGLMKGLRKVTKQAYQKQCELAEL